MPIVKRLATWLLENLAAATLIGAFLYSQWGPTSTVGAHNVVLDTFRYAALTMVIFMFGSGFFLTTGICRAVLPSHKTWLYPAIGALLFVIHLQLFASGWTLAQKGPVQLAGAGIILACAVGGNWLLHRWNQTPKGSR
jgi:hypothetical protein